MRRRYYKISEEAIASLLLTRGPETISVDGVPADAELISIVHYPLERQAMVIFEHDSFDDLPEGIPYMPGPSPTVTRHPDPEE